MYKEFTTYKQALALKELGFDESCFAWYVSKEYGLEIGKVIQTDLIKDAVVAPTFHQAFRFFREKHKSNFIIGFGNDGGYYRIDNVFSKWYTTYEEAEQECLNKLIKIVKDK